MELFNSAMSAFYHAKFTSSIPLNNVIVHNSPSFTSCNCGVLT